MTTFTTAIIVGSLRQDSFNLKLARAIAKLGQEKFTSVFVNIGDLPLFNQDLESDVPAAVTQMKSAIDSADAVLIVTPEYNRSMPGVLKNALDWASRPYGKNSFAGKPAAICGTSPGAIGSAVAQASLKQVLSYLDVKLMAQPEVYLQSTPDLIDGDGNVTVDRTATFLQGFTDAFAAWVANCKA